MVYLIVLAALCITIIILGIWHMFICQGYNALLDKYTEISNLHDELIADYLDLLEEIAKLEQPRDAKGRFIKRENS